MKTVHLSGKRLENYERQLPIVELTDLEKRRQPLRDLLADIDATHWCPWVDSWEPMSLGSAPQNPETPARSALPFSLQALDDLAALWVFWRAQSGGIVGLAHRAASLPTANQPTD